MGENGTDWTGDRVRDAIRCQRMNFRAHAFVASSLRLSAVLVGLLVGTGCEDSQRLADLEAERQRSAEKIAHLEESWMEVSDELVAKTAELNRLRRASDTGLKKLQSFHKKVQTETIALEEKVGKGKACVEFLLNQGEKFLAEMEAAKKLLKMQREAGVGPEMPPVLFCGVDDRLSIPERIEEERKKNRLCGASPKRTGKSERAIAGSGRSLANQSRARWF